jgi:HK97 family phage portal protein
MRIGRFEISLKAPVPAMSIHNSSALVPYSGGGGWLSTILEPFSGAWQRNIHACDPKNVLAFSAVYTCISLIAGDISKLRIKLVEQVGGIWREVTEERGTAFRPVLTKPNDFQTRIQFLSQWLSSKLTYGNAYILKRYDGRETVKAMYVLDPRCVTPIVTEEGNVWYTIKRDPLSTVIEESYAVPASEIIHDTMVTLWHPLVGVSPIYACGAAAMQGLRIQSDSEKFFANQSRPAGILSVPGDLTDPQLKTMKEQWDAVYGATGQGGTAVLKNGIKWEAMRMTAVDAQMIEQLRWTVEDVARCFHVPLHMLGVQGSNPSYNNIGALNQQYYAQTLQVLIECVELLLDEGLGLLNAGYGAELDLESLVRMDPAARIETAARAVGAGIWAPNEGRAKEDMPPVAGGDTPYLQQQNFSLAALDRRDKAETPTSLTPAALPPPDEEDDEEEEEDEETRERAAHDFLMKELADVEYA